MTPEEALLGATPQEVLGPLVAADGGELVGAAREAVVTRPGRSTTVRYAVDVRRGPHTGREGWVLQAGADLPAGTLRLQGPGGDVAAWRVRDDPALPSLRPALDRDAVGRMLTGLGLPVDRLQLDLLAYRPQRRAVVRATTAEHRLYLKCVPPDALPALRSRHEALDTAGVPVPRVVGADPRTGLLVLTPLVGDRLRDVLLTTDGRPPPVEAVVDVLAAVRGATLDLPARDLLRQVRGHARLLATVLPAERDRLDRLVEEVGTAADDPARTTLHGDFYDGQLLVRDGELVGVVDVDGAGRGHPADDAATLLGHLHVLGVIAPGGAVAHAWTPTVAAVLPTGLDPAQLRRRTAAVVVSLATWPYSTDQPRWPARTHELLDLAERVLAG